MENATKALIMAATILISIVIVSLGIYLAATFSSYSSQVDEDVRTGQIEQFNSQFLTYQDKEVTIYDILTVANLANENNQKYELTQSDANKNTLYITVDAEIEGIPNANKMHFENYSNEFANNYTLMQGQIVSGDLIKYKCTDVKISDVTRRVYYIKFE